MNFSAQIGMFSRVSFLDKLLFTKHLAVMLKSGITVSEALETLVSQTKSVAFKKVLQEVLAAVMSGQSLSKSVAKHPKVFNRFYLSLVGVGEESGTLEENLDFLAKQMADDYALRRKIRSAMIYPAIILIATVLIGGYISLFVFPKLTDLFKSLDVQLPLTTQILLFIATVMKSHGFFIALGFFLLLVLFQVTIRLPSIQPRWQYLLFSLPVIGGFLESAELSSFSRNLGIMLKSGLPITHALQIAEESTDNFVFKDYVKRILKSVERGKTIEAELSSGEFKHFPLVAVKMIGVGERTGKLDETLLYLKDFYQEDLDERAKNFSTILEPVLLLVIGLAVAFIALAIISPIYELTGSIKR
jgi:type II secretory pathway component PulF